MKIQWVRMALTVAGVALVAACTAGERDREGLQQGFGEYQAQRYAAAERAADEYIRRFPDDPSVDEAYYLRGVARMERRDTPGATADLQAALAKTQREELKAKANRALGEVAFDSGRYDQAITYYGAALDHYPKDKPDVLAVYRVGASLQAMGRWDEARGYFQRVMDLRTDPALTQRAANRRDLRAFSLQFGAFSTENAAQELARDLRAAGITAGVVREMGDRQVLYIVRAFQYRTYAEAEYWRQQYARKYKGVRVSP